MCRNEPVSSERQEADLRLHLLGLACQNQDFEIFDDLTEGAIRQGYDHPRHRHSRADTLPSVAHEGLHVVSDEDPALVRSELEESRVVRSRQRSILGSHHVKNRDLTKERAEAAALNMRSGYQSRCFA